MLRARRVLVCLGIKTLGSFAWDVWLCRIFIMERTTPILLIWAKNRILLSVCLKIFWRPCSFLVKACHWMAGFNGLGGSFGSIWQRGTPKYDSSSWNGGKNCECSHHQWILSKLNWVTLYYLLITWSVVASVSHAAFTLNFRNIQKTEHWSRHTFPLALQGYSPPWGNSPHHDLIFLW